MLDHRPELHQENNCQHKFGNTALKGISKNYFINTSSNIAVFNFLQCSIIILKHVIKSSLVIEKYSNDLLYKSEQSITQKMLQYKKKKM